MKTMMAAKPEPHLIRNVLEQESTAWLVGPPGFYKSFIALSMADAVANGRPWYGHQTVAGSVLYFGYDGQRSWSRRMAALTQVHGTPQGEHRIHLRAVRNASKIEVGSAEWANLLSLLYSLRPALIVIDDNARGPQNHLYDTLAYVAVQNVGSTVLNVHRNAVYEDTDTELTVVAKARMTEESFTRYVSLEATKQKDLPVGPIATLSPRVVEIEGVTDYYGDPVTSLVMEADA